MERLQYIVVGGGHSKKTRKRRVSGSMALAGSQVTVTNGEQAELSFNKSKTQYRRKTDARICHTQ